MAGSSVHVCRCRACRSRTPQPERAQHRQINQFLACLDERQRRWFVALEAQRLGYGGARRMAVITGVSEHTIRRGRHEIAQCPTAPAGNRIRAPGAGRRPAEQRDPALRAALERLLASETAGDPMGPAKYKRSSLRTLSARLRTAGHRASPPTVARLLRALGYSPKANVRRTDARTSPRERDAQFHQIAAQRQDWWQDDGAARFPQTDRVLILADAGGSNSCRSRVWKAQLQEQLCDAYDLTVTVCHYPTGCSKWNPIEHRLFSQISRNWAGVPLRTFDTVMHYINGTTTTTGLTVTGVLKRGEAPLGERVSDLAMRHLRLEPHAVCPQWSYTMYPSWRPRVSMTVATYFLTITRRAFDRPGSKKDEAGKAAWHGWTRDGVKATGCNRLTRKPSLDPLTQPACVTPPCRSRSRPQPSRLPGYWLRDRRPGGRIAPAQASLSCWGRGSRQLNYQPA